MSVWEALVSSQADFPLQGKPMDSQMSCHSGFSLFLFKGMKQAFRRFVESFCVYIKGGPFSKP